MKFRCKISNEGIKLLLFILQTLGKIHPTATILLSDDYIRFVLFSSPENNPTTNQTILENPKIYLELTTSFLCTEYRIESQHPQNTILFEMNVSLFAKALQSGKSSTHSLFKLTKKEEIPYFTMECKASESLLSADLIHDLPIQLVRIYEMSQYLPPNISKPQIAFTLPKNRLLKTLIDRLSKLNKIIYLIGQEYSPRLEEQEEEEEEEGEEKGGCVSVGRGRMGVSSSRNGEGEGMESVVRKVEDVKYGQLKLQVENYNVKIQSFLNNLLISNKLEDSSGTDLIRTKMKNKKRDSPVIISAYSKKLSMIFDYHTIPYQDATLFLTENEALVLHLELSPLGLGSISYYLPVLVNEESLVTANVNIEKRPSSSPATEQQKRIRKRTSDLPKPSAKVSHEKEEGYDTVNIESIKRILERETASRKRFGKADDQEEEENAGGDNQEEEDGENEEESDNGLWKDQSLLTAQYQRKETRPILASANEQDEEEDNDDDEDDQPRIGYLSTHNKNTTSFQPNRKHPAKSFLYSE